MALMPVADALAAVLDGAVALSEETIALPNGFHRVLTRDLAALRTQPPKAMSAMDGYAVRAADVATAPAHLDVIGEVAAGRPFAHAIGAGQAARIFTGGVVPDGADTVVIQENTTRDGATVTVTQPVATGKNIRAAGIDFHEGDVLLRKGSRLTDRALSIAASMNYPTLPVYRRPKVAILATGDELVAPGSTPAPGQIIFSNVFSLAALMRSEGAEVFDLGVARDDVETIAASVRKARDLGADILVTTGGASVGEHDLIRTALDAEGVDLKFWRIALRPGKPMLHGRLDRMRVLGLPGNPVSSYVCAFLFVVPLIRLLSGRSDYLHVPEPAFAARALKANDERQDYLRATLTRDDQGRSLVTAIEHQDSSLQAYLAAAQALIVRAPHAPGAPAGSRCDILKLPL